MIHSGYTKIDIEPYLIDDGIDVSKMTDDHWENIADMLMNWQWVDEDTLPDIVLFYESSKYRPNLPYKKA